MDADLIGCKADRQADARRNKGSGEDEAGERGTCTWLHWSVLAGRQREVRVSGTDACILLLLLLLLLLWRALDGSKGVRLRIEMELSSHIGRSVSCPMHDTRYRQGASLREARAATATQHCTGGRAHCAAAAQGRMHAQPSAVATLSHMRATGALAWSITTVPLLW